MAPQLFSGKAREPPPFQRCGFANTDDDTTRTWNQVCRICKLRRVSRLSIRRHQIMLMVDIVSELDGSNIEVKIAWKIGTQRYARLYARLEIIQKLYRGTICTCEFGLVSVTQEPALRVHDLKHRNVLSESGIH